MTVNQSRSQRRRRAEERARETPEAKLRREARLRRVEGDKAIKRARRHGALAVVSERLRVAEDEVAACLDALSELSEPEIDEEEAAPRTADRRVVFFRGSAPPVRSRPSPVGEIHIVGKSEEYRVARAACLGVSVEDMLQAEQRVRDDLSAELARSAEEPECDEDAISVRSADDDSFDE